MTRASKTGRRLDTAVPIRSEPSISASCSAGRLPGERRTSPGPLSIVAVLTVLAAPVAAAAGDASGTSTSALRGDDPRSRSAVEGLRRASADLEARSSSFDDFTDGLLELAPVEPENEGQLRRVVELLRAGRIRASISALEAIRPRSTVAVSAWATCRRWLRERIPLPRERVAESRRVFGSGLSASGEAATQAFRESARLDPNFGPAWVNLGVASERAGDLEGALLAYQEAEVRAGPRQLQARAERGVHRVRVRIEVERHPLGAESMAVRRARRAIEWGLEAGDDAAVERAFALLPKERELEERVESTARMVRDGAPRSCRWWRPDLGRLSERRSDLARSCARRFEAESAVAEAAAAEAQGDLLGAAHALERAARVSIRPVGELEAALALFHRARAPRSAAAVLRALAPWYGPTEAILAHWEARELERWADALDALEAHAPPPDPFASPPDTTSKPLEAALAEVDAAEREAVQAAAQAQARTALRLERISELEREIARLQAGEGSGTYQPPLPSGPANPYQVMGALFGAVGSTIRGARGQEAVAKASRLTGELLLLQAEQAAEDAPGSGVEP